MSVPASMLPASESQSCRRCPGAAATVATKIAAGFGVVGGLLGGLITARHVRSEDLNHVGAILCYGHSQPGFAAVLISHLLL